MLISLQYQAASTETTDDVFIETVHFVIHHKASYLNIYSGGIQ